MVAAKLKPMFEAAAKERQVEAGKNYGQGQKVVANLPQAIKSKSRDEAANILNISPRSVETASKKKHHIMRKQFRRIR